MLLRYFENRPFAEIGATLRLSDDAARMRVDRALEKLRIALARRGVKSTSAALATVFANQVAASAPAGLATTISGAALASAVGVGSSAAVGLGIFMSTKTTVIISAIALAAIGAAYFQWNRAFRAESELAALTVDRDGLRGQLVAEQQRTTRSKQEVAALRTEVDALKTKPAPPPVVPRVIPPVTAASITAEAAPGFEQVRRSSMNKAIMNNLRVIAAARDRFQREHGRPPTSLQELVGQGKYIPALVPVEGEDYSALPLNAGQPLAIVNSEGTNVIFDPSAPVAPRPEPGPAEQRARARLDELKPAMAKAAEAYVAAHPGANPHSPEELLPYFATPQEAADFVEALAAMTAARGK